MIVQMHPRQPVVHPCEIPPKKRMKKPGKKIKNFKIKLAAVLADSIDDHAFRANLENGWSFVAFLPRESRYARDTLSPGDEVTVCMSPFDMSSGAIKLAELPKKEDI